MQSEGPLQPTHSRYEYLQGLNWLLLKGKLCRVAVQCVSGARVSAWPPMCVCVCVCVCAILKTSIGFKLSCGVCVCVCGSFCVFVGCCFNANFRPTALKQKPLIPPHMDE